MSRSPHQEALDLAAAVVTESGARWGEVATRDQWEDMTSVLDPESPPYQYWTRARGYSKTTDLGIANVAMMLRVLPAGSRLYAVAVDKDQGRLTVDVVRGLVQRSPEIAGALSVDNYRVTSRNGSVLEIVSADAASAWGLRPSFVTFEELSAWASTTGPRTLFEAVTSAMAKVPGSKMCILTSAGSPEHWSHKVLEHAISDALWRTHEIAGPPPWADPGRLAEQKRRLPASSYARLFLNQWTASEDRLTSLDDLRACVRLDGPQSPQEGRAYVVGVDLGVRHDRTVAAVCHADREGSETTVVLDRMETWAGSVARPVNLNHVEEWLRETSRLYGNALVVGDPWQAIGLYQRLRAAGVRVVEFVFSATSVGRLATTLHTSIRDHHLSLPDDEALIDELANIKIRESSPGVFRIYHDRDKHDDRAVALGLAAQHLLESVPVRRARLRFYGSEPRVQRPLPVPVGWPDRWPGGWS